MGGLWRICDPVTEARAVGRDEHGGEFEHAELTEEYLDTRFMGGHNERFIYIEMSERGYNVND
jgi:hypothetical protein